ncbi:MAG: hypothetical protein ISR82_02855 [Candidatus Marinimicrobia bacterium]|nr:hypothetical protein [Candidatus Neomarinimicrobiota bacterium]MBL7010141.1 hypothetical protein [Candidatus Neomarinimicrobiota bacterium]MBL7030406.1 hypothetical protein [Candidatus Neomarinimicrobiota bacterium]
MRKFFILLCLVSGLVAQNTITIPFDWAGQNGIYINDGALFWNRDWTSGMLLFDGTYTSYSKRYGAHTSKLFESVKPGMLASWRALPDSNKVESYFDYYKGDYAFDQLEIGANYEQLNKHIGITGFKRTHGGNTGHYFYPTGGSSPIHHSYRIDYAASKNGRKLEVSAGRFVTRSGLPDSTSNGLENDNILSAGVRYQRPFGGWTIDAYFGQFFQHRLVHHSSLSDSNYQNINRNRLDILFQSPGGFGFGIKQNTQQINADTTNRFLSWSNFYAQKELKNFKMLVGVNQFNNGSSDNPFSWHINYQKELDALYMKIVSSGFPKPIHPTFDYSDQQSIYDSLNYEFWNHSMAKIGFINQSMGGDLFVSVVHRKKSVYEKEDANIQFVGGNLHYGFNNGWSVYSKIIAQLDSSIYGGGIGTITTTGMKGKLNLFKGNMKIDAHLWMDGANGKLKSFGFDPIRQVPFKHTNPSWVLPDQWLLHFKAVANISGVIVSYKINNVLNAVGSMAGASSDDLMWARPNHVYPQLGRMMQLGVTWYFKD